MTNSNDLCLNSLCLPQSEINSDMEQLISPKNTELNKGWSREVVFHLH